MISQPPPISEINELKMELTSLYESLFCDVEVERNLHEKNCNLRALLHLEAARFKLHKLKQIQERRNSLILRRLRELESKVAEKINKYKAMIHAAKRES
jgi:hypothetical protein